MKVWIVTEEEPDHDEFPSIIVGVYDNQHAADEHVRANRDAQGLADDDDYADADISWLVEEYEVHTTATTLVIDRHVEGRGTS